MVTDVQAQERLGEQLTGYCEGWSHEPGQIENLVTFDSAPHGGSWAVGLTGCASDYLAAALCLDAGQPPQAQVSGSTGRLSEALHHWVVATVHHGRRAEPPVGLNLYLWSAAEDGSGPSGVGDFRLDIGQVQRLGILLTALTPR